MQSMSSCVPDDTRWQVVCWVSEWNQEGTAGEEVKGRERIRGRSEVRREKTTGISLST
jgi:hypothetical protein